jgi:hypothetical protein
MGKMEAESSPVKTIPNKGSRETISKVKQKTI